MEIREATPADLPDVSHIHRLAFGQDEEAELVHAILADPSARPTLSLIARGRDDEALGHVLFSRARLAESDAVVGCALLAPLAVVPQAQGRGAGGQLIAAGLRHLEMAGIDLVFVLGDPAYYRRHGFEAAGRQGLEAPYPIADEHADAWMVQALRPGLLGKLHGKVICCDALARPELWRE
ncbi:MAG: GNAT family N-acetyltransferase [Kiloniellaceae bacterium]